MCLFEYFFCIFSFRVFVFKPYFLVFFINSHVSILCFWIWMYVCVFYFNILGICVCVSKCLFLFVFLSVFMCVCVCLYLCGYVWVFVVFMFVCKKRKLEYINERIQHILHCYFEYWKHNNKYSQELWITIRNRTRLTIAHSSGLKIILRIINPL